MNWSRGTIDVLLLLPTWLAFAFLVSKLSWTWNNRPEFNFGWIVLMLSLFLLHEAWPSRPARVLRWIPSAWVLFLFGLIWTALVLLYVGAFGMGPAALLGLGLGAYSLAAANLLYVLGRPGLFHFLFPLGFLALAFPPPSFLGNWILSGLKSEIATWTVTVLNLAGIPASQSGNLIHVATGTVGVEDACSGVRSLQSSVMATLFVSYLVFRNWISRFLLVAAGCMLAIATNLARSIWLSVVAHRNGPGSVDSMHDQAGWTVLACTMAGILCLAWLFRKMESYLPATGDRTVGKTDV